MNRHELHKYFSLSILSYESTDQDGWCELKREGRRSIYRESEEG